MEMAWRNSRKPSEPMDIMLIPTKYFRNVLPGVQECAELIQNIKGFYLVANLTTDWR
jgi:hypothetical protein